jgi:hypothetical protein
LGFSHRISKLAHFDIGNAVRLVAVVMGLLWCLPAHSQTPGRISGIVTDSSGGAIAKATVTVTDVERSIPRTVTTDDTGTYAAPNLIPGTYSVHVAFSGFKAVDRQNITVGVGGDVHVDISLQPGEQSQTVTVTEEVPAITTTNAQLSNTISGEALSDLPVAGHNYVQLLALLPTFQLRQGSATGPSQYSNGLRAEYNVYVLEGVADEETYYTTVAINTGYSAGGPEQAVLLPTDAIQEFNVVENSKAEYGWRPGAQVNVGVKSGSNTMHGSAFATGRGTGLTDKNAFATFKPPVSFEDFGATLGGKIKQDKLFYLIGYEGQRYDVGVPRTVSVPTLASIGSSTNSITDAITALQAKGVQPNPVMLALSGCTAAAVCTPGAGLFSNNTSSTVFATDFPSFGKTDNGVGRLDYHLNDKNNLAAEFFDGDGFAVGSLSSSQPYWSTPFEVHTRVARAWWTWVPNSSVVNDLRFGWDNILISNTGSYDCATQPAPFGGFTDNQWVPGSGGPDYQKLNNANFVSGAQPSCAFPTVTISGFTGNTLGGATGSLDTSGIERIVDSVSWAHGNHNVKFGGEFRLNHGTPILNFDKYKGTLNFNNTAGNTAASNQSYLCAVPIPLGSTCSAQGISPLMNFMAGIVTSASIQVGTVPRQFAFHGGAFFVQDDWRIFPRLTINLGLRYEATSTVHEVNNLFGNIALGTTSGIVQQQSSGSPLYSLSKNGIAPRFGLAWDITGKGTTVLRTGFNIVYQNPTIQAFITPGMNLVPTALALKNGANVVVAAGSAGTIDTANTGTLTPPNGAATIVAGQPYFTNLSNSVGGFTASCSSAAPCSIGGAANNIQMPQVFTWNLGVQHAITPNLTLDINYVGTHGQHMLDSIDINQPIPNGANSGNSKAENAARPYTLNGQYPWFGQIKLLDGVTNTSWYHGFQLILRQRNWHGLSGLAAYAYSHALDNQSSDLSPVLPQDSRNLAAEYGNSSFDLRHRLSFAPSYNIPGRPGYFQMLQGWQITTTAKVQSGLPINPIDATDDTSGTGEGQDRWTLGGSPKDFAGFGTASPIPCFAAPTAGSTWTKACTVGTAAQPLPQACLDTAAAEQTGLSNGVVTTGTQRVLQLGCYMMGNSVMVPAALGTFGTMARYQIRSLGNWEVDLSIIKTFKIKERLTSQFRAEIYNLSNSTFFAAPSATLSTPSTFGSSASTPDSASPFVGTGGPRKIQLGLKFLF